MAIFSGKIIEASYTNAKKDTVEIVYKEETKAIVYYIQTNHNHPHFQDLIKEYPLDKIQATTTAKIKQYNDNLKAANKADLDKFKQELKAKIEYLERRESELVTELENNKLELSEKSQLIDQATNKIEELLGSIDIDG